MQTVDDYEGELDPQLQDHKDRSPEELVVKMHQLLKQKISQLQAFEVLTGSYHRELTEREMVIKQQAATIAKQNEQLLVLKADNSKIKLELEELKSYLNFCRLRYENLAQQISPPPQKLRLQNRMKGFFKENRQTNQSRKSIETPIEKEQSEYIIEHIKLRRKLHSSKQRSLEDSMLQAKAPLYPGETIAQDFFVIGPDINDISIEKMKDKGARQLTLKPTFLYQFNKEIKPQKCSKRRDILLRSFPNSVGVKKLESSEYSIAVRQIVEYIPNYNLNPDYFIFTLLGEDDLKSSMRLPILQDANPSKTIFVLCLKLKDVVSVHSNNSIKNSTKEYWLTEKVYVVMSYYPFFDCHVKLMVQLQRINALSRLRSLQIDAGKTLGFGHIDMRDFTRSEASNEFIRAYITQKTNQIDWVKMGSENIATLPQKKDMKYALAGYASGYVFANICYEEFLVLLTAILSEKTVVFVSSSASLASFTALAFLGMIAPFKYPHPQILNADQEKIRDIIFQSPVPLLVSIATTKLDSILEQFMDANIENQRSPFILVDLDSSSILLDRTVRNELLKIVPIPSDDLKNLYQKHNSCKPRSVPLTKSMEKISGVFTTGVKKNQTKNGEKEQRRKQLQRQYKQQLEINEWPKLLQTAPDYQLVKLIYQFVEIFSVKEVSRKFNRREDVKDEVLRIKRKLYEENIQYRPFLGMFMETQIFNSHLDSKLQYN